jgi:hypothetical protein
VQLGHAREFSEMRSPLVRAAMACGVLASW